MKIFIVSLVTAVSLFLSVCVYADEISCSDKMSHHLYPSIQGMPLGSNDLGWYFSIYGEAEIHREHYVVTSFDVVCYRNDAEVLKIYKWAGDGRVRDAELFYLDIKSDDVLKCKSTDRSFPEFAKGLRLGAERSEIISLLGQPNIESQWLDLYDFNNNTDVFIYSCKYHVQNDDFEVVIRSFDYVIKYNDNKVKSISTATLFFE